MATVADVMTTEPAEMADLDQLAARVDDLEMIAADRERRIVDLERALALAADAIGSLTRLHMIEGIADQVESGMVEIRDRLGWPARFR